MIVEIVPYDPTWPERFRVERELLAAALPEALSIEHIGSTSVPGMAAKPIIDILAVVPDTTAVRPAALQPIGYVLRAGAFEDPDHLFFPKDTAGVRTHHLHVFGAASPMPAANRRFREYLVTHPDQARRYAEAKRRAAALHPDSRGRYAVAKEPVMSELLEAAERWHPPGDHHYIER